MKKIFASTFIIVLILVFGFVYKNFHLFEAKYAEYEFNKNEKDKLNKNKYK